jgi:hypothetical protein
MDSEVRRFASAVRRHWVTLMVGGASIIVTVVGIVGGEKGLLWAFGLIGFCCIVAAFYLSWRDEYRVALALPWKAALDENRELERRVRELMRARSTTSAERERAQMVTELRESALAIPVHLLSDNWLTQLPHFEAEGRKVRSQCLQFQRQLAALPASDAPFLRPGMQSYTVGQVSDCLEDNRLFLENRIADVLAGRA